MESSPQRLSWPMAKAFEDAVRLASAVPSSRHWLPSDADRRAVRCLRLTIRCLRASPICSWQSSPAGSRIYDELAAQVRRIQAAGIVPTHLDTHKHTQPGLRRCSMPWRASRSSSASRGCGGPSTCLSPGGQRRSAFSEASHVRRARISARPLSPRALEARLPHHRSLRRLPIDGQVSVQRSWFNSSARCPKARPSSCAIPAVSALACAALPPD